jgi:CSLREA domain-containing protein
MRTRLMGSKVTLLLIVCAVLIAVPGAAGLAQVTGTTPVPTIQSDKADYPPSDTVILTGSGWQPGETVNINVNDDENQTWNRNVDVIADENGNVRDEFVLPDWFVATYSVTATGASGAIATSTFTDAQLPSRGCTGPPSGPALITVSTTADQFDPPATVGGGCSLREAISAANADAPADTILLFPATYTLTLTGANEDGNATGDLDITRQLAITGSVTNARNTIIQAGTTSTNGIDRVLHASSNGNLTLSGVTVRYGQINDDGGGIKTDRNLTLTNVAITENDATTGKSGGGISHQGNTLTINGTTISGNTAADQGGGFHTTSGNATLTNVTITNNTAANGGGIRVNSGTKTLVNATVSHNTAPTGSNIDRNSGTINLRNTIVSDGSGGQNCNGTIGNTANNLDSGTSCGFGTANNSKSSANANLGALTNNTGPTDTRALLSPSAAIDAGTAVIAPNVDQRGESRPKDGDGNGSVLHDIGAYEAPTVVANTAPATTVPTFNPASPKTNDVLQASTTTSDADANSNVSVAWVWKVTRGANTCQVNTETSAAAAPGVRTSSLDLSQNYMTSNCTGASPPTSINPSKGDTVIVEATPNDGTVNGTMRSSNVVIANSTPTCAPVSLTTDEDTTESASPSCTDADGDTLTFSIVAQGTKGTASVTGGLLQYVPILNENGADTFTYKANDGSADSNTADVNVTIDPVNDPPSVGNITGDTTASEGDSKDYSVTATDVDGDTLTYAWTVKSGAATITNGAATNTATVKFLDGPDDVNLQVVVSDDNGGEVTKNLDSNLISVANVAPELGAVNNDGPVDEGSAAIISAPNATDPAGANDPLKYEFDCNGVETTRIRSTRDRRMPAAPAARSTTTAPTPSTCGLPTETAALTPAPQSWKSTTSPRLPHSITPPRR